MEVQRLYGDQPVVVIGDDPANSDNVLVGVFLRSESVRKVDLYEPTDSATDEAAKAAAAQREAAAGADTGSAELGPVRGIMEPVSSLGPEAGTAAADELEAEQQRRLADLERREREIEAREAAVSSAPPPAAVADTTTDTTAAPAAAAPDDVTPIGPETPATPPPPAPPAV